MLSKEQVDEVGDRIESIRKRPPKPRQPTVPDEAVDECESSHVSGSGSNSKTNMDKFDDGGVMALVCRHDIPLFLANIDSPGEQQKYGIALIEHLCSLMPPETTVAVLYDVGCVLDRSLQLVSVQIQCIHNWLTRIPSMTFCQNKLPTDLYSRQAQCTRTPTSGHASSSTILVCAEVLG